MDESLIPLTPEETAAWGIRTKGKATCVSTIASVQTIGMIGGVGSEAEEAERADSSLRDQAGKSRG